MARPTAQITFELGHVCMNHFAVLDLRLGPPLSDSDLSSLSQRICKSPLADDLLVMGTSEVADIEMRIFGADGRQADCCGNGSLLVASLYSQEADVEEMTIETCNDLRRAARRDFGWSIDLGPATAIDAGLRLPDEVSAIGLVRAGEPHLVIRAPERWDADVRRRDFERYCRPLRDVSELEGGVNVTMVFDHDENRMRIRTFERGSGRQSYSCGTGSVAAVYAVYGTPDNDHLRTVCAPGGCHDVRVAGGAWELGGVPHPIGKGLLTNDTIQLPINNLFDANVYEDLK